MNDDDHDDDDGPLTDSPSANMGARASGTQKVSLTFKNFVYNNIDFLKAYKNSLKA